MPGTRRRRFLFLVVLGVGAVLSASMLAPAFGAPKAVSATSLAAKLANTLKIAKRADRNAKRAIAGLQSQGGTSEPGAQGPAGPAGPKGDKGELGSAGNTGATGSQGAQGPQGKAGPSAINLNVNLGNSNAQEVAVGTFTLKFNCFGSSPGSRQFILGVRGSGGAQLAGVKGIDDHPSNALPFTAGVAMSPDFFTTIAIIGVNAPNPSSTFPHFYRLGGTMVMHNGLRSATVVYDMFLDDRNNSGTCAFRGSAVLSD